MQRGKTEADTLHLNGWQVGDILEGQEGNRLDRILITQIGQERFLCRWKYSDKSDFGEESGNTTLAYREWRKVGHLLGAEIGNDAATRPLGWYWIKNPDLSDGWIAAHWTTDQDERDPFWIACGEGFDDDQCTAFGGRLPSPDEPWQAMPETPTDEMVDEAAKAIASWDEGCVWPDSWGADAERHRKDVRKVFHALRQYAPRP